jgi:hypothetical protein
MRAYVLFAAIGLVVAVPTLGFAQQTPLFPGVTAPAGKSLQDEFNRCAALARQRGYNERDLSDNRPAVRNFVIRCMQGKQK